MTDQRLDTAIREAFESAHIPSPDLDDRVIAAMPWGGSPARPERAPRASLVPRLAGAFVVILAGILIAALVAPSIINRLNAPRPGGPLPAPPAYSLAAVTGDYLFVVQRGEGGNVLLRSDDNGRTWAASLRFSGLYAGTEIFGGDGVAWSLDAPETFALHLYRTTDGGDSWKALPATSFPVQDVYFLDANHGWADSSSIGLNAEVLYETTDGGTTWTRVGPLPPASPMGYVYGVGNHRVTFSKQNDGSLRGWYVGNTELFTTTDGGRSWSPVKLTVPVAAQGWTATPQQPVFDGEGGVVVIAYRDPKGADNATANSVYLYATSDGGATWGNDPLPGPVGFAPVGDIIETAILDPAHVWLTSQSITAGDNVQAHPAIARTDDGGITWHVTNNTPRILQIVLLDPLRGYALDVTGGDNVNGILRTEDAGKTWQRVNVPVFKASG